MMEQKSRMKLLLGAAFLCLSSVSSIADNSASSEWFPSFNNKSRVVAGRIATPEGPRLYAGLEIVMPEGWKTYWRSPGDAGGVPPEITWTSSANIAQARVLYPAPERLADKSGTVVGYKNRVLFPIAIEPKDASKPVTLHVNAAYGVCKNICVPAEADFTLELQPGLGASADLADAIAKVPNGAGRAGDPALSSWRIDDANGKKRLVFDVASSAADRVDAFIENVDGSYMPVPKPLARRDGQASFEVDLASVDLKSLKGATLRITMVDPNGQAEATFEYP
jgi:DsbC/DsbD-like thiol-disulfide interchange protein